MNDVVSCLPERRATSISRRRRLFARSFVVAVAMITYRGGRATTASGRGDNDGVKKLLPDACSASAVRPYIFLSIHEHGWLIWSREVTELSTR